MPPLALLEPARAAGFRRLAVIGIPCQVYALRALEAELGFDKLYVIGTPCSDNTTTARFHEFLGLLAAAVVTYVMPKKYESRAVLQIPAGVSWKDGKTAHLIFGIAAKSDEHIGLLRQLTGIVGNDEGFEVFTTDIAQLAGSGTAAEARETVPSRSGP